MSVLELSGPEAAKEAAEATLTWEHSAVVVRDAISNLDGFSEWTSSAEVIKWRNVPIDLATVQSGFAFDVVGSVVSGWFAEHRVLSGALKMHQHFRNANIAPHCDSPHEQPFVISVGLSGSGNWDTQLASDEVAIANRTHRVSSCVGFDEDSDEFEQAAGDLVFIPGYNEAYLRPAMHAVHIGREARRTAVVYRFAQSTSHVYL